MGQLPRGEETGGKKRKGEPLPHPELGWSPLVGPLPSQEGDTIGLIKNPHKKLNSGAVGPVSSKSGWERDGASHPGWERSA